MCLLAIIQTWQLINPAGLSYDVWAALSAHPMLGVGAPGDGDSSVHYDVLQTSLALFISFAVIDVGLRCLSFYFLWAEMKLCLRLLVPWALCWCAYLLYICVQMLLMQSCSQQTLSLIHI